MRFRRRRCWVRRVFIRSWLLVVRSVDDCVIGKVVVELVNRLFIFDVFCKMRIIKGFVYNGYLFGVDWYCGS